MHLMNILEGGVTLCNTLAMNVLHCNTPPETSVSNPHLQQELPIRLVYRICGVGAQVTADPLHSMATAPRQWSK